MTNQRKHVRLAWEAEVEVEWAGCVRTGRSVNVSIGGLFVAMNAPPPLGSRVTIRVRLPGVPDASVVPSVVRWSLPGQGFGAQFESLRAIEVWALNRLLRGLTAGD